MSRKKITEILEMAIRFSGYEGLKKNFQSLKNVVDDKDWDFLHCEYDRIYKS